VGFWVAALAVLVFGEKVAPMGERLGRIMGAGLIAAGITLMIAM
jgi:predicted metal-binding membrane protein